MFWLGWKDLNPRMWESESHALPLGDTPLFGSIFKSFSFIKFWLGWLDLNQRMRESKSRALPLGDTPLYICGVSKGFRTLDLQSHNLAFYQLNYDHHKGLIILVLPAGFEPATSALEGHCSIQLSYKCRWSG